MRSGDFLPHSRQEALRIKESGYPKYFWFALECCRMQLKKRETDTKNMNQTWKNQSLENPSSELSITFQKFSEPETQSGTLP